MFTAFLLFTDDVIFREDNNFMKNIDVTEIIISDISVIELNLQVIQVTQII